MDHPIIAPGALDQLHAHVPKAYRYAVIADANIAPLYADRVIAQLAGAELLEFPAGEANKTRETWGAVTDLMLERGFGRDCCVIALGGGVTCDLAGFVAATYMRGVPVVQVPTSLLAMIDAAIGGKTGVDTSTGKNLVGAFHMPHAVVIDPLALTTLEDAELSTGLAEAIKHGAIADAAYLAWITQSCAAIFDRDASTLEHLVRRSVEIKLDHVRDDLREADKRAALNFGHTIGHALEHVSGYEIGHGDAVALGMLMEVEIGNALGVTAASAAATIMQALEEADLPFDIAFDEVDPIIEATRSDKKARAGTVRYTLLEKAGAVARSQTGEWTIAVADEVVRAALEQFSGFDEG